MNTVAIVWGDIQGMESEFMITLSQPMGTLSCLGELMTESEFLREWKQVEPKVRTVLKSKKTNLDDIEDIVMDTWLKCMSSRHTCDRSKFKQWVMIIALNKGVDLLRKPDTRAFRLDAPLEFDLPGGRSSKAYSAELVDRKVSHKPFAEAFPFWFYRLPKTYQTVARLRACGCSVAEIAAMTGDTTGSVKIRLHRAKKEAARLIALDKQKDPTGLG
jgi:RNA polymerase sigma factor (sigma-70 family)